MQTRVFVVTNPSSTFPRSHHKCRPVRDFYSAYLQGRNSADPGHVRGGIDGDLYFDDGNFNHFLNFVDSLSGVHIKPRMLQEK